MAIDQGGNLIATKDIPPRIHRGAPAFRISPLNSGDRANSGLGGALNVADRAPESTQRRPAARRSLRETTTMGKVRTPLPEALWRLRWPWKCAADVTDPEMHYWLRRVEASCQLQPPLSLDLLRAAKIELRALDSHRSRSDRLATQFFVSMALFALIWWLTGQALLIGALPGIPLIAQHAALTFLITAQGFLANVRPWITDHFAHRTVLARDRLNRWLVPAFPDLGPAQTCDSRQLAAGPQ